MNWGKAKYPGDAVRIAALRRGDELGDVRIMHYGHNVQVAAFLPGRDVLLEGDTPKTEPENYCWFPVPEREARANKVFGLYVAQAKQDGWTDAE